MEGLCVYDRIVKMFPVLVLLFGSRGVLTASPVTVNLFSLCGDGETPDYQIPRETTVLVSISGSQWPAGQKECPVIFHSYDNLDNVIYKFKQFNVSDPETKITLYAGFVALFSLQARYDRNNNAPIDEAKETNTYLRIAAERTNLTDRSLSAIVELQNEDFARARGSSVVDLFTTSLLLTVCTGVVLLTAN